MAISANITDRQYGEFKESSAVAGQVGVVVINPDGTNVASSGIAGTVTANQGTVNAISGAAVTTSPTTLTFNAPIKMVSGVDIVTTSVTPATWDVFISYWQ